MSASSMRYDSGKDTLGLFSGNFAGLPPLPAPAGLSGALKEE